MQRLWHIPGRSQNERSATPGPLICRLTQFIEKLSSVSRLEALSKFPVRKSALRVLGLRIAFWALRILSSTSLLSLMTSPNLSLRACPNTWPFASVVKRRETIHCQGCSLPDNRHSVGHLNIREFDGWIVIKVIAGAPCTCPRRSRQRDARNTFDER